MFAVLNPISPVLIQMTTPEPDHPSTNTNWRVLLVHECGAAIEKIRALLSEFSSVQQIEHARNAGEALRLFLDWRPDLIIASVNLPGTSGFELLRWVKQANAASSVYLVSHCNDDFIRKTGMLLGANGVCSTLEGLTELRSALKQKLSHTSQ